MSKNYNYVFLFYDIKEKRVHKVFKICKKYLTHYQFSVFRGEITPSEILKLKNELLKIINKEEDTVCIIKLMSKGAYDQEIIGVKNTDEKTLFF